MKKLSTLGINPSKIIKNKELIILRGGYSECCNCWANDYETHLGQVLGASESECNDICWDGFGSEYPSAQGVWAAC